MKELILMFNEFAEKFGTIEWVVSNLRDRKSVSRRAFGLSILPRRSDG